jgi:hypothetical protein
LFSATKFNLQDTFLQAKKKQKIKKNCVTFTSRLPLTASDANRFCRAAAAEEAAAGLVAAVDARVKSASVSAAKADSVTAVKSRRVTATAAAVGSVPVKGSSSVAGKTSIVVSVDLAGDAGTVGGNAVVSMRGDAVETSAVVIAAAVVDTTPAVVDTTPAVVDLAVAVVDSTDSSSAPPVVFFLSARLEWRRARILLLK